MNSKVANVFFRVLCLIAVSNGQFNRKNYDFIIVGAGSAGSVLANRLSENPKWNVLLLEAGKEPLPISDIPLLAAHLLSSEMNWGYTYEKQDNIGHGIVNGRVDCSKGKSLGGGSSTNFMLHTRGHKRDFNNWCTAANITCYENLLPYFKKSETSKIAGQDPFYHGSKGPLHVESINTYRTKAAQEFASSFEELGYKYTDYNGRNQSGVSFVQTDTKNGTRSSACRAYLDPIRHRKNLEIVTQALVSRVVFKDKIRADGVEVIKDNRTYVLRASKEVIVSCGALNSPQVMMLSGVGPKDHLRQLGIEIIKDLPVGEKLYDHLTFLGFIFTADQPIVANSTEVYGEASRKQYETSKTGPFTSTGLVEALGFVKTTADPDSTYPDVQLSLLSSTLARHAFRIKADLWDAFLKPLQGKNAFTILPILYHPKSCGYVRLNSTNPRDPPKFFGNHLTDPRDVDSLIRSIRIMEEVIEQPSFKRFGVRLWGKPVPGCEGPKFDSDAYWRCALSYLGTTIHHPTTTCKMGSSEDAEAVVNFDLRVHGLENLRVVDSSVIPEPQSTHSNVATIMLGERAADIIKEFHHNNR